MDRFTRTRRLLSLCLSATTGCGMTPGSTASLRKHRRVVSRTPAALSAITILISLLAAAAMAENGNLTISATLLSSPVFVTNTTQLRINITNAGDINLTNITIEDRFLSSVFSLNGFSQQPTTNLSGFVRVTGAGNTNVTPLAPNQSLTLLLNYTPLTSDLLANHTLNASSTGTYNATTALTLLPVLTNATVVSTSIAGDPGEPDDNATFAKNISVSGIPEIRNFGPAGDQDWFVFTARKGSTYDIAVINITPIVNNSRSITNSVITIFNSTLATVQSHDDSLDISDLNPRIVFRPPTSGTYFIRVTETDGSPGGPGGTYQISAQELGRLTPTPMGISKTTIAAQETFTVNASFQCTQGFCPHVQLTLDPEQSSPTADTGNDAANTNEKGDPLKELIAKEGHARVIIKTRTPPPAVRRARTMGTLGAITNQPSNTLPALIAQSASIQHQVVSSLSSGAFIQDKLLPAVSIVTGTVTAKGLQELTDNPDVEAVYLDVPVKAFLNESSPRIRANLSRNITINTAPLDGAGIGVCVIDTGVSYNHTDFGNCTLSQLQNGQCQAVQGGFDFFNNDNDPMDDDGHGSHVAGIIASRHANFTGIAPKAHILAIKSLGADGNGLSSNIIAGINWCITNQSRYNISVITMSLGDISRSSGPCDRNNAFADPINRAVQAGILVSIASGNAGFGSSGNDGLASPACVSNATAVGATATSTDTIASFTNRAINLNLLAPGQPITATQHDNPTSHIALQGTSMAAPHISGAAALVYQRYRLAYNRTPTPREIEQIFAATGIPIQDGSQGSGTGLSFIRIDSLNSVNAKGAVPTTPGAKPFWTPNTNPVLCGNLTENQTCNATWTVNASNAPGRYEFFVIAFQETDTNITPKVNVTVLATAPSFVISTLASPQQGSMGTRFNATLNITNTGATTLTNATIALTFNATDFLYTNATPSPTNVSGSTLTWINPFSALAANASLFINVSLGAKNRSASVNSTITVSGNASDSALTATAGSSTTVSITAFNIAPVITTTPPTTATIGITYTYDANASDENGDTATFLLASGPTGMTMNSSTGLVTWTPLANQTGLHNASINASDPSNASTIQTFTINATNVNLPPTINSTPVTTATEDVLYQYTVTANDPENGSLTFSLASAPSGMSINNATGTISWTPLNHHVGINAVRVNASDTSGNQATQQFNITVANAPSTITTTPRSSVIATTLFSYDANSSDDGQGNITYTLSSGPVGVSVNTTTGMVAWTPAAFQIGGANITIVVDDGNGGTALQKFSVNVTSPFNFTFSGPSSANMSGTATYTSSFLNMGNSTLNNGSLLILYNASDATSDNNPVSVSQHVNATTSVSYNKTQPGIIIANITGPIKPGEGVFIGFSLTLLNRTGNHTTIVTAQSDTDSNGTALRGNGTQSTAIVFVNFAPSFNSTPPLTGTTTVMYTYDADAVDGNGDNITFGLMISPTGMIINNTTGLINFTPGLFQNGSFNVTINASDGRGGVGFQSFTLNISRLNRAPNITTIAPPNATEDSLFTYDVNATDPENDTLVFLLDLSPAGMTINNATGIITWTANNTQVGTATVRVNTSDGLGGITNQTFPLTVINNPPSFTTTAPTTATFGTPYTYDANTTDDGQGNITYTVTAGPENMTINTSTGMLSWTPTISQLGIASISLAVNDGNGGLADHNFTINTTSSIQATASSPPSVLMNQEVSVRLNATSITVRTLSNLSLTARFNASDLLFLNATPGPSVNASNGTITFSNLSINLSGQQTTTITILFLSTNRSASANTTILAQFSATDNATIVSQNTSRTLQIDFSNFAPRITSTPAATAILNTTYTYDVEASDGNNDPITFNLTAFPAGMSINASSGLITWLANVSANHTITIAASDPRGASATQTYTLEVRTLNHAPAITTTPVLTAIERSPYTYDVNATDPDNDAVSFSLVTGPTGMTISASTGLITMTPNNNHVGTASVTVKATDPFGSSDNQSYTLVIQNAAPNITTAPLLTAAERGNYSYDANSSDDGFGTITYALDAAPAGMSVNASTGLVSWSPATAQVGPANVSLRVSDGNNGAGIQNFTINVSDLTPPNITLLGPANGTSFNRTNITVTFAASDNAGIAACTALINTTSSTILSASGAFNKSQTITATITLAQGSNNVTVTCTDTANLQNASASILIFADSIVPTISVSSPINGQNISGNLSVTYSVSDATLDKVQFIINAGTPTLANASGTVSLPVSEGIGQNLTILANDSVGLVSNTTIRFNVDRTAPLPAIGAPGATTIFGARGATIFATSINSTDNLGIASTTFDFDHANGILNADAVSPNATKNYTGPGTFVVTLTVTDPAGNTARANATVLVARDSDGDGFPDESAPGLTTDLCPFVANASNAAAACTNDADGDGVNDSTDTIIGNASAMAGNLASPSLVVGSSTNPATATGFLTISIASAGVTLITFDFNFTNTTRLVVPNITILRQTAGVLVSGLPSPINKSIILPKDVSTHNAVCIKDNPAQSFAEISSGCTGSGEIQVNCTGANQGKTCTDTGSGLRVSNLAHTIVTSFALATIPSGGGTNGTMVQNGTAIVTGGSTGGGGSFNARGESDSDRRVVSSSFTPAPTTAVQIPTTKAPSAEEKETAVIIVPKPKEELTPEEREPLREEAFFVSPAPPEEGSVGIIIAVIVVVALLLCAGLAAIVWWAWR